MKVANKSKDNIKTERQWNMAGYKVRAKAEGEVMWTNQFCGNISRYFHEKEVEKMNPDEKATWLENDRLRRNEMARESRRKRIEEQKRWQEQMKREIETYEREWKEWREAAAAKIEELKTGSNRLAAVAIENYGIYFYEVPASAEPKTQGIFPFGKLDERMPGIVEWIVPEEDLEKIGQEEWFPYGLKKILETKI